MSVKCHIIIQPSMAIQCMNCLLMYSELRDVAAVRAAMEAGHPAIAALPANEVSSSTGTAVTDDRAS